MALRRGGGGGGGGKPPEEPRTVAGEYQEPAAVVVPQSAVRQDTLDMVDLAIRYPREGQDGKGLARALDVALAEIELAPEVAERNWYMLPFRKHSREGDCTGRSNDNCPIESKAEGLSVKAAYTLQRHWKHLASKSYYAEDTADKVRVVGVARDLQSNNLVERDMVVLKKIYYRNGGERSLSEQEVVAAIGRGTSKAIRNAILNQIPDWFKTRYWNKCREVDDAYQVKKAGGKEQAHKTLGQAFAAVGVTGDMLVKHLGKPLKEATDEERIELRGLYNAIASGETTVADAFPSGEKPGPDAPATVKMSATATEKTEPAKAVAEEPQEQKPNRKRTLF